MLLWALPASQVEDVAEEASVQATDTEQPNLPVTDAEEIVYESPSHDF